MYLPAIIAIVGASALIVGGCNRLQSRTDPKEKELASIPVGIVVTHTPNPAAAQEGVLGKYRYGWVYRTTVRSTGGPLKMEEFGALGWSGNRWVFTSFTGKPFTAQDFAEWYSCPGAKLQPSTEYSDPKNWTGSDTLRPSKSKWYFIARDETGRRVKGEAVIDALGQLAR